MKDQKSYVDSAEIVKYMIADVHLHKVISYLTFSGTLVH